MMDVDANKLASHSSCSLQRKTTPGPTGGKDKGKGNKDGSPTTKPTKKQQASPKSLKPTVNPVLAGILHRNMNNIQARPLGISSTGSLPSPDSESYQAAVAQAAVGKGIRHGYGANLASSQSALDSTQSNNPATNALKDASFSIPEQNDCLYQLACNYRNSLNDLNSAEYPDASDASPMDELTVPPPQGLLKKDDSLIDLAMIPGVEDGEQSSTYPYNFVDFPNFETRSSESGQAEADV